MWLVLLVLYYLVLGIVDSPAQAETTVERLHAMGFEPSEVSVLYDDRHGSHDFSTARGFIFTVYSTGLENHVFALWG